MKLGSRARITIAGGLTAATVFVALGIWQLRQDAARVEAQAVARPNPVAQAIVLVSASRPIEVGETITADMVRSAPGDPVRFPSIATPGEAIGKVATRALAAGALIPRDAIDLTTKLAIRVPLGMRAMSIETTAEIAVSGLLRPGDHVDVQVVYPGADALSGARGNGRSRADILLQNVLVLAVGESIVGGRAPREGDALSAPEAPARTVTLALSPDQVATLSLAKSTGALLLSLRNPKDAVQVATQGAASTGPLPVSSAPVVVSSLPVARAQPQSPARSRASVRSQPIEVIVGDRREVIYTGNAPQ